MENFETIKLTYLVDAFNIARDEKQKYGIFFDKTGGNAATFFHYKAKLRDFFKELFRVEQGIQTKEQAAEVFR